MATLRTHASLSLDPSQPFPNPHLRPSSALSARTRPLSACSTLSAVSASSSLSASLSLTGLTARRRSTQLLDLSQTLEFSPPRLASSAAGLGEQGGGGGGVHTALQRASAVLLASERERELDRRRQRASWRTRQVRSALDFAALTAAEGEEHEPGAAAEEEEEEDEELDAVVVSPTPALDSPPRDPGGKRWSPKRFLTAGAGGLRKVRSIPTDLLLASATSGRGLSGSSGGSGGEEERVERLASPPHPHPSSADYLPPRPASSLAAYHIRSHHHQPVHPSSLLPRPSSALDRLTLPGDRDPPSKFSGSSGDSILHVVAFSGATGTARNGGKLKERARTFSQAGLRQLSLRAKKKDGEKGTEREKSGSRDGKTRRKPSLANLFAGFSGGGGGSSSSGDDKPSSRSISFVSSSTASKIPTSSASASSSGHRPSTSISSFASASASSSHTHARSSSSHARTSSAGSSAPPSRKPSRLGFFKTLRGAAVSVADEANVSASGSPTVKHGSIRSRTISRPISVATSLDTDLGAGDRRFSATTDPSGGGGGLGRGGNASETSERTRRWFGRLTQGRKGGNVAQKRALFEGKKGTAKEEKASPAGSARLPSRIPLATVFHPPPPARPPRPAEDLHSPSTPVSAEDTTFYSHRIPVKSRAAEIDASATRTLQLEIQSSAPRVRAKTGIPVRKPGTTPHQNQQQRSTLIPAAQAVQQVHAATFGFAAQRPLQPLPPPSSSTLLPPAPIYPSNTFPSSSRRWTPESFSDPSSSGFDSPGSGFSSSSSSEEDDSSRLSPHGHQRAPSPFRSPSPARFRDLLPSASAQSSPERNERGLPMPLELHGQPQRWSAESGEMLGRAEDSPKKRAMGPEQVIVMEDARERTGPINEVRGATTDLADLLSSLDDTEDLENSAVGSTSLRHAPPLRPHFQTSVNDLSRCHLPHANSIESLRSTVSDVPQDLKDLIDTVDDHISEVDVLPSFAIVGEGQSMGARGFADEFPGSAGGGFRDEDDEDSLADSSSSGTSDDNELVPPGSAFGAVGAPFLSVLSPSSGTGSGSGGDFTTGAFSISAQTVTLGVGDATTASFEGHFSTADAVLRSVLAPPMPPVPLAPEWLQGVPELREEDESSGEEDEEEEDPRVGLRESVREALDIGRPSHGDRMFDDIDCHVQLTALLHGPSPPLSPEDEQSLRSAFISNHLRNGSLVSSTEGSIESHFTMSGSPTPFPRSGRPVRQSLARYSQDHFPTKRPSHRARPVSEQSSASTAESEENDFASSGPSFGHGIEREPTSLSLAHSTRSTNLSISSLPSSPCPVPKHRRIPMLTRAGAPPPPLLQPAFKFPPDKPGPASATITLKALGSPFRLTGEDPMDRFATLRRNGETEPEGVLRTIKSSTSPRFVRPLQPQQAGEPIPRPRLLELQQLEDSTVPPDTPPPSSPSVSDGDRPSEFGGNHSRQSSVDLRSSIDLEQERPYPTYTASANLAKRKKGGHSRQVSRSSSILQSTIVEEAGEAEPDRPDSLIEGATVELAVRLHLQPLSPIREPPSPPRRLPLSPQTVPHSPYHELPSVEIVLSPVESAHGGARVIELDGERSDEEADFEFTAETSLDPTWRYFTYEAETEIKRSITLWSDTDFSREVVALFDAPRTYHAILEFLFYSQTRFPSPPHLFRLNSFVPPAFDDPPTPPSPVRIPSPIVDSSFETKHLFADPLPPSPSPPRPTRKPLTAKPLNKQVAALSQSTSSPSRKPKQENSPFTALPPKLGFRAVRGKFSSASQASKVSASPPPAKPKKAVDTAFLGAKVSSRRQTQLDAAMRRLEGTGKPSEQRSDSESDFTGVLEANASGELTGEVDFKSPRLSFQRPRVRRKTALSSLR